MNKTVLIVIAAHHLSGNVASLRYRGLLKYVNADNYRLFVITQPNPLAEPVVGDENIVEVEGKTFSRSTGYRYLLYVVLCTFWKTLPFRIGRLNMNSWTVNAALAADTLISKEQADGNRCIVLGTFCPLDAVVASSCVASRNDVTLIQDFRDGLGFEPIGNQSFPALLVKRILENRIVAGATGMLAVSDPIVDYLRMKYPDKQLAKISNGYDREDFQASSERELSLVERFLRRSSNPDQFIIGHFGQASRSDPTSFASLVALIESFRYCPETLREKTRCIFMGELTSAEREFISTSKIKITVLKPRSRSLAIEFMKKMDLLLLLTGTRKSVVTGKIYDYLAVNKNILHISQVHNEAEKVLKNLSGTFQYVIAAKSDSTIADIAWAAISKEPTPHRPAIKAFDKSEQARQLEQILQEWSRT